MAIWVKWLENTKNVIYWKFDTIWNWEEFYTAMDQSSEMSKDSDYTVGLILDILDCDDSLPSSASKLYYERSMATGQEMIVVLVSDTRSIRAAVAIFTKVYVVFNENLRFASSLVNALYVIQSYRSG